MTRRGVWDAFGIVEKAEDVAVKDDVPEGVVMFEV